MKDFTFRGKIPGCKNGTWVQNPSVENQTSSGFYFFLIVLTPPAARLLVSSEPFA
jgi:hypothetical protein